MGFKRSKSTYSNKSITMTLQTFYAIITGVIGACWGSFLNVAFYREANRISLSHPPSHCPNCKKEIPFFYNIPILGWFFTGGKCFNCRGPVSPHYPAIELLVAAVFVGCQLIVGAPLPACLLGALVTLYALGAIFDHRHFIIPDVTLNGALLLAFALIVAAPGAVLPGAPNNLDSKIMLLLGGLAGISLLFIIKSVGQMFLCRTEEFGGRMIIDKDGIKSIYPNGEEFVTKWTDFSYSKVIPRGNVKVLREHPAPLVAVETAYALQDQVGSGGQPVGPPDLAEYGESGESSVIIYDEEVRVDGRNIDLSKGIEISADGLYMCRSAMGVGDIRLMASLGMLAGVNWGLLEMLFFASCTGTAHGLYLRRKDRRLPFGPHLMIATAYVIASRYKVVPQVRDLLIHLNHAIH